MTQTKPENPRAFPLPEARGPDGCGIYEAQGGMSLRDWFAGRVIEQCIRNAMNEDGSWDADNVAYHAYLVADAMLAARATEG